VSGAHLGFGEGANRGAARALSAGARAVSFVNNDVTLPGRSLEPLVARLFSEETIGIVGPRVLYADDRRSPHS
jgi:GT2 family glycosyltransferase